MAKGASWQRVNLYGCSSGVTYLLFRDRSLDAGRGGGLINGRVRGQVKFHPYTKGCGKSFSHDERGGGGKKF